MTKQAKQRLLTSLYNHLRRKHPNWSEQECRNFVFYTKTDTTANGLTSCIVDFLRWEGWQAERINTTGLAREKFTIDPLTGRRIKSIGITWTPTTGTRGSADISATIAGRSVKIEVKVGQDRQSDAQRQYEEAVTSAGGVYIIARDFAGFLVWYDEFIASLR
jgi:hypothetical protein